MNRNRFVPSCMFFSSEMRLTGSYFFTRENEKCNSLDACININSSSGDRNLLIVLIGLYILNRRNNCFRADQLNCYINFCYSFICID